MTRLLGFLPFLAVLGTWGTLRILGGHDAVVVITGMLPAGMGPEAVPLGVAYVAVHLAAIVLGPPLAGVGVVWALRR
ncbi:MAG: hypothetical protein R3F61_08030 [Myxococcota bacterium]